MNKLPYHFLVIWLFVISKRAFPLPITLQEKQKEQKEIPPLQIFIPETAAEEKTEDPPVFIMVPVLGERQRRDSNKAKLSLEEDLYEMPTVIQLNDSLKDDDDFALNLVQRAVGSCGGKSPNNCCPPTTTAKTCVPPGGKPICLTISIDNLFPPCDAACYSITNSSEIKGTGAVLKINFYKAKNSVTSTEITLNFDSSTQKDKCGTQRKKKIEDDYDLEEDERTTQLPNENVLHDILLKILAANKTHKKEQSTLPQEDSISIESSSFEPSDTFDVNPSIFHKISGKIITPAKTESVPHKDNNHSDFDQMLKTVEHSTSTMTKDKLILLLSSLLNKAALNKNISTEE